MWRNPSVEGQDRFQAEREPGGRPESGLDSKNSERVRTQNRFTLLLNAFRASPADGQERLGASFLRSDAANDQGDNL
jgi:hypothetical protein